jgi:outer membrane protein assembly factor BamB
VNHPRRWLILLVFAAGAGCHKRIVTPVASLFPLTTAWVANLENDGDTEPQAVEAPLATDGQRVFVASRGGIVYAFDAATGTEAWRSGGHPGRLASSKGAIVVRQADGVVSRLDPADGKEVWRVDTKVAGDLPPVLDGQQVFIVGKGIACLDMETGAVAWRRADSEGPEITSGPTVERAFLVVGRQDGAVEVIRKRAGISEWTYGKGDPVRATPVVDDKERVLVGNDDGSFLGIALRGGKRHWRWKVGADVRAGGVLFEKRVLFASLENVVYALDRGKGHMIWRSPLPSRPLFTPLVIGVTLLVPCADADLIALEPKTGKNLGTASLHLGIEGGTTVFRTAPLRIGGRLYVGVSSPVALAALNLPAGVSP